MKVHEILPIYLLQGDGTVIEAETGEVLSLHSRTEYRLQTSEKLFLETKGKTIDLVRRFTKAQIIKMYNSDEAKPFVSKKHGKTPVAQVAQVAQVNLNGNEGVFDGSVAQNETGGAQDEPKEVAQSGSNPGSGAKGIYINGAYYSSARQAAEMAGISKDTINRRIKSSEFPTYYKIE